MNFSTPPMSGSGTGVHALDSGFVQVLADLRSDRRHLLVYDSSGSFEPSNGRSTYPSGFSTRRPTCQQLLALRRTDRPEIVTYEWNWQSSRAVNGPERKE